MDAQPAAWSWSPRIATALTASAMMFAALVSRPSSAAASAPSRIPVEVELQQPEGLHCGPGNRDFDFAFRAAFRQSRIQVVDTSHSSRIVANAFCFASDRPDASPIRVYARIRSDDSAPAGVPEAHHWLLHVAVPIRGIGIAPARWQRASFTLAFDRSSYCDSLGRAVGLYVLEALHRETRKIRPEESVVLGARVAHDPMYREALEESAWSELLRQLRDALPALVLWLFVFLLAFVMTLFARRHSGHRLREQSP